MTYKSSLKSFCVFLILFIILSTLNLGAFAATTTTSIDLIPTLEQKDVQLLQQELSKLQK